MDAQSVMSVETWHNWNANESASPTLPGVHGERSGDNYEVYNEIDLFDLVTSRRFIYMDKVNVADSQEQVKRVRKSAASSMRLCAIQPHGQMVHLDAIRTDRIWAGHMVHISNNFRLRMEGCWMTRDSKHCPAPPPLKIARLSISASTLRILNEQATYPTQSKGGRKDDMMYLVLIEGLHGSNQQKMVVTDTTVHTQSLIFYELANGYSVVLVAIMLRTDFLQITENGFQIAHCSDLESLRKNSTAQAEKVNRLRRFGVVM